MSDSKNEVKQGIATVETTHQGGATVSEKMVVSGGVYDQPTCNIGYKAGITKNLGDYESLRIDVSLNMPCYPEEIDDVFEFQRNWVENKLNKSIDDTLGGEAE